MVLLGFIPYNLFEIPTTFCRGWGSNSGPRLSYRDRGKSVKILAVVYGSDLQMSALKLTVK